MSDQTRPTAIEPPVGARPATGKPGERPATGKPGERPTIGNPGPERDPESAVPAPAPVGDESTSSLPEDVGWPGRGEPCA